MEKENVKKLSFWLGLICALLIVIEIVLGMVGITFEIKIVIEVVSYVPFWAYRKKSLFYILKSSHKLLKISILVYIKCIFLDF